MLQSNESGEEFKFKLEVKNEESKRSNESTNNSLIRWWWDFTHVKEIPEVIKEERKVQILS